MLYNLVFLASFLDDIPFLDQIVGILEGFIPLETYIDQGYTFITELSYVEQLLGSLILGVILILGLMTLIKKLSKLIIVAAILFGLWLLYQNGVFS
jgi:hypothetical protein